MEAERRPDVSRRAAAVIVAIVGTRRRRRLVASGAAARAAMAGGLPLSRCRRAAQEAASKRRVVVVVRRGALGVRRAPQSGEAVAMTMRVMRSRGRWLEEVEAGGAIAEEGVLVLSIRLEVDQVRMARRRASVGRIDAVGAAHDVLYGCCCVYVSVA